MNNDAQASAVPATETVVSPETSTVTAPHTAQATSAPVVFEVKSVVQVDARLEAGSNKPGGVARVVRVHQPGEAGADDAILYDVKYVLGGGERGVPARFVHAAEIEKQAGGEGAGTSRASRAARASPASASVVPATETVPSAAASRDGGAARCSAPSCHPPPVSLRCDRLHPRSNSRYRRDGPCDVPRA